MFRSPPRGIGEGYRESVEDHSSGRTGHRSITCSSRCVNRSRAPSAGG